MSKRPIPWFAFVVIGILVSAYAKFVQSQNPENTSMTLFFYVGIILALYGVGKYLLAKRIKIEASLEQRQRRQVQQEFAQQKNTKKEHRRSVIPCPKCGAKHYAHSNFCHMCGIRLK